jgi:hypothetical protein
MYSIAPGTRAHAQSLDLQRIIVDRRRIEPELGLTLSLYLESSCQIGLIWNQKLRRSFGTMVWLPHEQHRLHPQTYFKNISTSGREEKIQITLPLPLACLGMSLRKSLKGRFAIRRKCPDKV